MLANLWDLMLTLHNVVCEALYTSDPEVFIDVINAFFSIFNPQPPSPQCPSRSGGLML